MKMIFSSRRHRYMARISIFLITVVLIAGMVGCGDSCGGVKYNLTMEVAPAGNGTATDLTNASPYRRDTVVSIQAIASPGYRFRNWTAPAGKFGNATAAQTTFTMPAQNVTVTANFAPFAGGSGTEGDPYQIADWYQLHNVRNYLDSHFILVNNLNSTTAGYAELASPTANQGKGWQPIGTSDDSFNGTVDGQGYEIKNLYINRTDEAFVGLFGWAGEGSTVRNLGVTGADITGEGVIGGLVGNNEGGTVSNSYSSGNVTGNLTVGGLVGWNSNIVSNSYSTGSVTGNLAVGGLVGAGNGTVSNSYSIGSVTGDLTVGGLVGWNSGNVSNSYATGSVTGNSTVGGLVGYVYSGTVSNSYSTGSVTGNSTVGGLVGYSDGTVSNSFWDTETSGQGTSAGGTGENTTQMKDITTFSGATWDIVAVANSGTRNTGYIWNIVDDATYPFLSWQP
jgi:hypothetical protein